MNTNNRYPRKAWKLMPSFKPIEIELVGTAKSFGEEKFAETGTGSYIALNQVFDSRDEAIAAGWARVDEMKADLEKRRNNLSKRMAALTKAARGDA